MRSKHIKIIAIAAAVTVMGGCQSSSVLHTDTIEPIEQSSYFSGNAFVPYKNGFFTVISDNLYYCEEGADTMTEVTPLVYVDDKPVSGNYDKAENYSDSYNDGLPMYLFDEKLVYISYYLNTAGESKYRLNALSLDGKDRTLIIDFDYQPSMFILQSDRIFVCEQLDNSVNLHVYDLSGKEEKTIELDGSITDMKVDGNSVRIIGNSNTNEITVYEISCDTLEYKTVTLDGIGSFVYESNGKTAAYYLNRGLTNADNSDVIMTSYIMDNDTKQQKVSFTNEVINYFDDTYIYTSLTDLNQSIMKYDIYDWNGNLVKEIIPSDSITSVGETSVFATNYDFSVINRIVNGNIISYSSDRTSGENKIVSCSIEDGSCRYIEHE